MTNIVIIKTGGSNFASIQSALCRLGYPSQVTDEHDLILQATHVILPGVGAAGYGMRTLQNKGLDEIIPSLTQPVLGICLGMQMLCAYSAEDETICLNIIPLSVSALMGERIYPHMGWNQITSCEDKVPLLQGISPESDFYFVHNFAPEIDASYTKAVCDYGHPFSALIQHKNFFGVQFHPEKSGEKGALVLKNFIEGLSNEHYS